MKTKGKKGGKDKPKNVKSNTGGEQFPEVCTMNPRVVQSMFSLFCLHTLTDLIYVTILPSLNQSK